MSETRLPPAGLRTWLQLHEINETGWSGLLLLAFHWGSVAGIGAIDDNTVSEQKKQRQGSRVSNRGRRGGKSIPVSGAGWHRASVAEESRLIPMVAVSHSVQSEVFERDLFIRPSTGETVMWLGVRVGVTCRLQLDRFPLDRQNLRVGVTCRNFVLVPWGLDDPPHVSAYLVHGPHAVDCRVDCGCPEWRLAEVEQPRFFDPEPHSSYARLNVRLERLPDAYLWNIGLVNFLCVLLHTYVIALAPTEPGDRLGIGLTLLLTIVALRHTMSERLPVANCLTLLDKYLVGSKLWLVVCVTEVATIDLLCGRDRDACAVLDRRFHLVSAALWVVLHALGLLYMHSLRRPWDQIDQQYARETLCYPPRRG